LALKAGPYFTKVRASRSAPEFADYLLDIAAPYPEANNIHVGDGQPEFTYPQGERSQRDWNREIHPAVNTAWICL
jgi:hypothetical protein